MGGHVNVKDAFYLMNSEGGQNYYLSVNPKESTINGKGPETVLELSAGFAATKFRSKLFLDAFSHFDAVTEKPTAKISNRLSNSQDDQTLYSGDTVRLLH